MVLIAIRLLILLFAIFAGKAEGFTLTDEAKESMRLADEARALITAKGGDSS